MIEATTSLEMTIDHINRKMSEEIKSKFPDKKPKIEAESVSKSGTQIKLHNITPKVYDGSMLTWSNFAVNSKLLFHIWCDG